MLFLEKGTRPMQSGARAVRTFTLTDMYALAYDGTLLLHVATPAQSLSKFSGLLLLSCYVAEFYGFAVNPRGFGALCV